MKPSRWFISDTHFFHENIIKFSGRPFGSVEEMNEVIVENWNKTVKPNDIVFHLGDVAFQQTQKRDEIIKLLKGLNGTKYLSLGNHDHISKTCFHLECFEAIDYWRIFPTKDFFISHVPFTDTAATYNFRGVSTQVHGHIHQNLMDDPRYINVCVEHTEYKPVHLDEIIETIKDRNL